ncbi:MAG: biopolymer transporter ExbD [Pontiellaceae bacterium]|nr:biopolymer transporter ExbD [Pontiellaceae bacterium]
MKLLDDMMNKKAELQIAPLIDVVFLLLIYFMVTSQLKDPEADLSFTLPAPAPPDAAIAEPWEVVVEIGPPIQNAETGEPDPYSGEVMVYGLPYGTTGKLDGMIEALGTEKATAESSSSEFVVTIIPDNEAMHGRIVQVMDACAAIKAKNVAFGTDPTQD